MQTPGHPVVVAKNRHEAGRPTVLMYGHYDVQPPEPLDLWTSPPFDPTTRDGKLFARGAADDKGPVWAHCEAVIAWQANGGLPVNLTILIEGEEENASENLEIFRRAATRTICGRTWPSSATPASSPAACPPSPTACAALCYQEVILTGTNSDLHSGMFGGAVPNAANELCKLDRRPARRGRPGDGRRLLRRR